MVKYDREQIFCLKGQQMLKVTRISVRAYS